MQYLSLDPRPGDVVVDVVVADLVVAELERAVTAFERERDAQRLAEDAARDTWLAERIAACGATVAVRRAALARQALALDPRLRAFLASAEWRRLRTLAERISWEPRGTAALPDLQVEAGRRRHRWLIGDELRLEAIEQTRFHGVRRAPVVRLGRLRELADDATWRTPASADLAGWEAQAALAHCAERLLAWLEAGQLPQLIVARLRDDLAARQC